jgi:hypothetical protein
VTAPRIYVTTEEGSNAPDACALLHIRDAVGRHIEMRLGDDALSVAEQLRAAADDLTIWSDSRPLVVGALSAEATS